MMTDEQQPQAVEPQAETQRTDPTIEQEPAAEATPAAEREQGEQPAGAADEA